MDSNLWPYLSPFPRYGHLQLENIHWKLRQNRCR